MQSRLNSLAETCLSTAIGFIVSLLVWQFIVRPVWSLTTSFVENLGITLLFTIVSLLRQYMTRRLFVRLNKNNKNHEQTNRNNRTLGQR